MAKAFQVGDLVRGVILLELDSEKSSLKEKYWKYACPICGIIKSSRASKVGSPCLSCSAKQKRKQVKQSLVKDDLTNKNFGYWKVLFKSQKSNYWFCECQLCGTQKEVFRGSLTSGNSKSCGCIKSWGEQRLIELLNKFSFNYKREISFNDLKGIKNGLLRFDFGIYSMDNNELLCLIEYDGEQHFNYNLNWNETKEQFQQRLIHDDLKNKYCQLHNIPLYRLTKETDLESFIYNLKTQGGA